MSPKQSANDIIFDELESVEFKNKIFFLSGKFNGVTKKKFAEKIEALGGKCRGYGKSRHPNRHEIDYFVISDNGLLDGRSYGNKAMLMQENNSDKRNRHIPIIKESDCLKFIMQEQIKLKKSA